VLDLGAALHHLPHWMSGVILAASIGTVLDTQLHFNRWFTPPRGAPEAASTRREVRLFAASKPSEANEKEF
jgi:hypothetical protein